MRNVTSRGWILGAAAAIAIAVAAMNVSAPIESRRQRQEGKLLFQIVFVDAEDALDTLSEENKELLSESGYTFTAEEIISHPVPATGMWLKIGEDYVQVDQEGNFEIPERGKGEDTAYLYPFLADEEPTKSFDISDLSEPLVYTIRGGTSSTATLMDGTEDEAHRDKDKAHGPQVPSRCDFMVCNVKDKTRKGCCQDFDGPFAADPKKRLKGTAGGQPDDECKLHRYRALIESICGKWIRKGPCAGEAAVKGVLLDEPNLPGCFAMHRGRWCQHLDPDEYSVKTVGGAPLKVKTGGTLRFEVVNNTPENSTGIRIGKLGLGGLGGKFELIDDKKGALSILALAFYRLDHFKDKANPTPDAVYSKKLVIEYEAPDSLPGGESSATEEVTFSFWGEKVEIEIEVES